MKKLLGVAIAALLVVGIVKVVHSRGSDESKARAACENLVKQCGKLAELGGEKMTSKDVDECTQEVSTEGPKELGDQYGKLTGCMADADNCGEALGCIGGAAANELGDQLEGMGKGFEKMSKKR